MKDSALIILKSNIKEDEKAVLIYDLLTVARKLNNIDCIRDINTVVLGSNLCEENKDGLFEYGYQCFKSAKAVVRNK